MFDLTATVIVVAATSGCGFLSLLATLVFLWKIYKRGGRHDLTAAARALRDLRTRRLPLTPLRTWPAAKRSSSTAPQTTREDPPAAH